MSSSVECCWVGIAQRFPLILGYNLGKSAGISRALMSQNVEGRVQRARMFSSELGRGLGLWDL